MKGIFCTSYGELQQFFLYGDWSLLFTKMTQQHVSITCIWAANLLLTVTSNATSKDKKINMKNSSLKELGKGL